MYNENLASAGSPALLRKFDKMTRRIPVCETGVWCRGVDCGGSRGWSRGCANHLTLLDWNRSLAYL